MPLSDDDKLWFTSQFGQIDARFEQIDARFEQIDARLEQIDRRFERVDAKIEQVETSLLTEFHKWASPTEARLRKQGAIIRALEVEMESLAERVKNLERRAN